MGESDAGALSGRLQGKVRCLCLSLQSTDYSVVFDRTTLYWNLFADGMRNKQTEQNFDCSQFQNFVNHFNNFAPATTNTGGGGGGLQHHPNNNSNTSSGGGILNPIDRLYSMQSLYFCGEKVPEDLN